MLGALGTCRRDETDAEHVAAATADDDDDDDDGRMNNLTPGQRIGSNEPRSDDWSRAQYPLR